MTTIAQVETSGIKRQDASVALGPKSILLGPVGAGKSTILDAIRFAALGCVPHLGRSEAATAALLRTPAGAMMASVTLSDGRVIGRGLARESNRGRSKLTSSAMASWVEADAAVSEAHEAIVHLFGTTAADAAEHLDLRELFACSPAERSRRIAALLDASGMDPKDAAERVVVIARSRLASQDPAGPSEIVAGDLGSVAPAIRVVAPDVLSEIARLTVQAGIARAEETARETRLKYQREARERVAARKLLQEEVAVLRAPAESAATLRERREVAIAMRSAAARDIARVQQAAEVRARVAAALPALEAERRELAAVLEACKLRLPEAEVLKARAHDLALPLPAPASQEAPPPSPLWERVETVRSASAAADAVFAGLPMPRPALTTEAEARRAEAAASALALARESPWREVEAIADDEEACAFEESGPSAPYSVAVAARMKRLRALALRHGGSVADIEAVARAAAEALAQAEFVASVRANETTTIAEHRSEAELACSKARAELANAVLDAQRDDADRRKFWLASQCAADAARDAEARERVRSAEASYRAGEEIIEAVASAGEALARVDASIRSLNDQQAGIAAVAIDAPMAQEALARAETEITALTPMLAAVETAEARAAEIARLVSEIEAADALGRAWSAVEWSAGLVRQQDVAARSGGILRRTEEFLRAAGWTETPFIRAGKAEVAFGWTRDGLEITVEAMSGGEAVVFSCALAAAVISLRAPEVRVLLVEAAELGASSPALSVLAGAAHAVEAWGIQAVVATNAPIDAPDGWTVVRCAAEEPRSCS